MDIQITYEMCQQGTHWQAFMSCPKMRQEREWLCSFENTPLQDGLAKCREFAVRIRENILLLPKTYASQHNKAG